MNKICLRTFLLILLFTISACKPIWYKPPLSPDGMWQQRLPKLEIVKNWQFDGRTAITQGNEGWNAGIKWRQQQDDFLIKLTGPFAQGGSELAGDKQNVVLTTSGGERVEAVSPEALLKDNAGLQLPVSALRFWVRGLPYRVLNVDAIRLDPEGRITYLNQEGWKITIKSYIPFGDVFMPAKVFIRHDDLSIRLIISDWSLPS
jgi:outer membrane lipoprotein LolB